MFGKLLAFFWRPKTAGFIEMQPLLPRFVQEEVQSSKGHDQADLRRHLVTELSGRLFVRSVHQSYLRSRNLFQDRLERVLPRLFEASLAMKEERARTYFSSSCVGLIREAAVDRDLRMLRPAFSSTVLPSLVEEASLRHEARAHKAVCLLEIRVVGSIKSGQRLALHRVLCEELPAAIGARQAREEIREQKRSVLREIQGVLYQKELLAFRLKSAELHEKLLAELMTRGRRKTAAAPKKDVSSELLSTLMILNFVLVALLVYGISNGTLATLRVLKTRASKLSTSVSDWHQRQKIRRKRSQKDKLAKMRKASLLSDKKEMRRMGVMRKNKHVRLGR